MPRAAAPARWTEYLAVSELVNHLDPRNPKDHTIGELRDAVRRFGFTEPVLMDERTGMLVAGHGRVEALDAMEGDEPPTDLGADEVWPPEGVTVTDGAWTIPVTRGWSSKNDDEAGAYLVASNQLTIAGGWVTDPLVDLLTAVRDSGAGLLGMGFTDHDVSDLLASVAPPPSLDDLADQAGPSDPTSFWPVLRFKVPPPLKERFATLVAGVEGGDVEAFEWLVTQAEQRTTGA